MPETKDLYRQRMEAELEALEARIELLRAQVEKAEAGAKIVLQEKLAEFARRQRSAREQLRQLRAAGEATWEEAKAGIDRTLADLKEALEQIAARLQTE